MNAKSNPVSDKIAQAQSALKAGELQKHEANRLQDSSGKQVLSSWGPMMRV